MLSARFLFLFWVAIMSADITTGAATGATFAFPRHEQTFPTLTHHEIERMRRGAVYERGVERPDAPGGAEKEAWPFRRPRAQYILDDPRCRLDGTGECDTQRVEDGDLAPVVRLGREVLVTQRSNARREFVCQAHEPISPMGN